MLLTVSQVKKSYGVDVILTSVTFRMQAREKVALVGRNGAGKSTLLKILTGQENPDTGSVQIARGAKIGYLKQEAPVTFGRSVIEEAEAGVEEKLALRDRLQKLEQVMEAGTATPEDVEEYGLLHEHFLEQEGYSTENDVRRVLMKMGFTEDEFSRPTDALSGGEKTRLAIARLLLEEPDLLILDEPTNHLDLQATEWLEGWLRGYHGAVLLVSHDRAFLENTADQVLDMRDGQVFSYPGPFEKFLKLRQEEIDRQAEVARRQDLEIAKMDEYVRRFMNSQRTAQARGRLKQMNRLIESKVDAVKNDKGIKGAFTSSGRSGDVVISAEKLAVGFDGIPLYTGLDWTVRNTERWGVIGENGAGKSTLIRAVFGNLEPMAGRVRLGAGVVAGYFSQDATDLDPQMSPLDVMVYEMDLLPAEARHLLGRFLLSGDDVYRPIKTLSGGEKNKLALARLTHLRPNLLVLDEPTNHLDMASREALAEILKEYQGTLVLVSHDRWLLNAVTDQTLDIRKAGPVQYPGNYNEYRRRQAQNSSAAATETAKVVVVSSAPTLSPRELSKEIGRLEKLISQVEKQVEDFEAAKVNLELKLANIGPADDVVALSKQYQGLDLDLAAKMDEWETESARLEDLRAMQGR